MNFTIKTEPLFCSGFGQFHSNEETADIKKHYVTIGWDEIRDLVDNPQQVDKTQAQWLIPSTLLSRASKTQEANGVFWLSWADIDTNPVAIAGIAEIIERLIPGNDFEIYTSKSATQDNPKCRVLIPFNKPLCWADWSLCQEILSEHLQTNGIEPDRSSERPAQLCYLPNRGAFYDSKSKRGGIFFEPLTVWADAIESKKLEEQKQAEELEILRKASITRKEALKLHSNTSAYPSLIDAFKACYTVEDILLKAGYAQHPRKKSLFRHPNSESGSYSASIKEGRVHSLSSNDPLFTGGNGGGAHDAFSAFAVLFHHNDERAALKDAGDNWLMIGTESWNTVKQREYAQQKQQDQNTLGDWMGGDDKPDNEQGNDFSFANFNITEGLEIMRKRMLTDVFVMDGVALLGQLTAIYAPPNTGKTLLTIRMLIDSAKAGRIDPQNVFYINADDTFSGLITKGDIFKEHGLRLIAPGINGFEVKRFSHYLDQLIKDGKAHGVIIVLDTLKKFSDLMDKSNISRFMVIARKFAAHGGTMIMLGHTNKRRDGEKKLIVGGTSDVVDDSDCAFVIDAKPTGLGDTTKTIIFENIKCRGDVEREICFSYSIESGKTYAEKLDSVMKHSQSDLNEARKRIEQDELREKDSFVIELIQEAIRGGIVRKTEIIVAARRGGAGHHTKVRAVIDRYQGKLWGFTVAGDNAHVYYLIGGQSTAEEYETRKWG